MVARGTTILGAFVLTLGVTGGVLTPVAGTGDAAAASSPGATSRPPVPADGADHALGRLRAAAAGTVRVHRDSGGRVGFVRSGDGRAMVAAPAADVGHPRSAAAAQLARFGPAFGIDGGRSRAVVTQSVASATGGSVVRAQQYVDGLPVVGGDVVMSLDRHQGVVSVTAATTPATDVPSARVTQETAALTARSITARDRRVPAASLRVAGQGEQLYDPALAHLADPLGARPVWSFAVTGRGGLRETVLVGATRGEVALHYDDSPELNRAVCDDNSRATVASTSQVPVCSDATAARLEGGAPSAVNDVNEAYDNLGATADTYASVDNIDLTNLIGYDPGTGTKHLQATVRWCYSDDSCPYDNAFWDGRQMVFGAGYAGADDVVGHELTHGYVERTANLFAFHQSGAINESLADTIGEIVDHRDDPSEDNSAWTIGEDLPGGALRDMKDPTLSAEEAQPDRMQSPHYGTDDFSVDNGDVHQNNGVGNKTAYLISQGGTFDGVTVTGIDSGDPMLTKTALLYLETIPHLTSGSQYADLARALTDTCDQLAAGATGGFTSADCTSVRNAVTATQMLLPPADPSAAAPQVAATCPTGTLQLLRRDDDGINQFGFSLGTLWQRTPVNGTPPWASSGTSSLFAWDPDPQAYGDPSSSSAISTGFVVPSTPTYLHFHHAYVLDFVGNTYYDGGTVLVQTRNANGTWTTVTGLPWVNGPNRTVRATTPFVGWGGDSHGYETSRVELSSLAGRTARVVLRLAGDDTNSYVGWWVDDVREYTCTGGATPGTPRHFAGLASATAGRGRVSWQPPAYAGTGVSHYRVTRSDGRPAVTLPTTARSLTLTGLRRRGATTVRVVALDAAGQASPGPTVRFTPISDRLTTSTTRVRKGRPLTVAVLVRDLGTPFPVSGMRVTLQRRAVHTHTWRTVGTRSTWSTGVRRWVVTERRATDYRVLAHARGSSFGSTSVVRRVRVR